MREEKKYQIIYADPPWSYNDKMTMKGKHGVIRGAESFYKTMSLDDIKKLPIEKIADDNCSLYLWATAPLLNEALEVIKSWGFKYVNIGFCWVKKTKNGKNHCGMGYYTRGNIELCLFGVKGKVAKNVLDHSIRQVVEEKIGRHSAKPNEVRKRIIQLFGDTKRIELFAREKVEGWDVWGNEVESDIKL